MDISYCHCLYECERHYWNGHMCRCDETNYLAWLIPCTESLSDHVLYAMIEIMLCGSCVHYFAIPCMCDAKHGHFHHVIFMCTMQDALVLTHYICIGC